MKFWMKYAIGVVLGVACAFVFKFDSPVSMERLAFMTEIFTRIGRYCVVPLITVTAAISIYKLIQSKIILKTALWSVLIVVASSLLLTILGVVAILFVKLPRIPITVERTAEVATLGIPDTIRSIFPYSSFETLLNGTFLFAPFFFALCIGIAFAHDEVTFRPVILLADSLSKLFYTISKVVAEILSVGMIAITCSWLVQFRDIFSNETFFPIFVMLSVLLLIVAFIIYPLIVYLVCHDKNPYRILYASICPFLVTLLSGDANLTLPVALLHTHKSLGIRRRINGTATTLISIFARGGTSLVLTICFIVIRRSYSDLSIPFNDILWLLFISFAFSFLLGGTPVGGTFIALSVLCTMYGKGFEAGFLLLRPASFMLGAFAAAFNLLTIMFGSYIVAIKTNSAVRHGVAKFI